MSESYKEVYEDSDLTNLGRGFGLPPSMLEASERLHNFLDR